MRPPGAGQGGDHRGASRRLDRRAVRAPHTRAGNDPVGLPRSELSTHSPACGHRGVEPRPRPWSGRQNCERRLLSRSHLHPRIMAYMYYHVNCELACWYQAGGRARVLSGAVQDGAGLPKPATTPAAKRQLGPGAPVAGRQTGPVAAAEATNALSCLRRTGLDVRTSAQAGGIRPNCLDHHSG